MIFQSVSLNGVAVQNVEGAAPAIVGTNGYGPSLTVVSANAPAFDLRNSDGTAFPLLRQQIGGVSSLLLTPPPGLGWTPSWSVRKTGNVYDTTVDFDALKPASDYDYYGSPGGSAAASPASGDSATPITPRRFVTLANAHTLNERLLLAGGRYYGNFAFDGNTINCKGTIVQPTGVGGRPIMIKRNSNAAPTWTLDQGSTYYTTHAGNIVCLDLKYTTAGGVIPSLLPVADLATCRATPGTSFFDTGASRMYAHASDDRNLVGDVDVLPLTNNNEAAFGRTDDQLAWLDGTDFLGGTIFSQSTAAKVYKFYARNCGFFGGQNNALNLTGPLEVILLSPRVGGAIQDAINYNANAAGAIQALEYDVRASRSGLDTNGTNNTSTLHLACKAIRVAGDYAGSQDRTIHDINNAKSWNIGCTFRPGVNGPATVCAGSADGQAAEIWLDGCTIVPGSTYDLFAYSGSAIHCANMPNFASLTKGGTGTIDTYTPTYDNNYDVNAAALFARMTVAPDATRKQLISDRFAAGKAKSFWAKLDALWVHAAHDAQAARLNWIANQYDCLPVNSPAFTTDRGYSGDGSTSYLNTQFNPATATSPKFTQNSGSLGVRSNTDNQGAGSLAGFYDGTTTKGVTINPRNGSNRAAMRANQVTAGESTTGTVTSSIGMFAIARVGAGATTADVRMFKDGAYLAASGVAPTASVAVASGNFRLGSISDTSYRACQFSMGFCGSGFTDQEMQDVYDWFETYRQAVGVT